MRRFANDPTGIEARLAPWGEARLLRPITGGHRNAAYLVTIGQTRHVAKTGARDQR